LLLLSTISIFDSSRDFQTKDSDAQVMWQFDDYTDYGLTVDLCGNSLCCSLRLHCGAILHSLFPSALIMQLHFYTVGLKQFPQSGTEGSNH